MPNWYLVGMMGSGKTATGRRLAFLLGCSFSDLDQLIEEKTGRTVVEIFAREGEAFFRDVEAEVLREVSGTGPRVIAAGGGTVLRADNVARMRQSGKIIFLEAALETLWERVKDKKDRPLLKGADPKKALEGIFLARKNFYEGASDLKVQTDGQSPEDVAKKIFELLKTP